MSGGGWYLTGLLTLPAAALAGYIWLRAFFEILRWFADRGMTANFRRKRHVGDISAYELRRDIWWERAWGPIFAGGWYRESAHGPRFTRWVGLGSVDGPCLCGFWLRAVPRMSGPEAQA